MGIADRYTILKKVADGGMAEIFLATQAGAQGFERTVVLKRILPDLSADPQFQHMLVDEAHIAMGLNHSNIVQVLDLGEAEGRTFLVLELVDGWDLQSILARAKAAKHPLPPALALYVTAEVCRALAYAHGRTRNGKPLGIVHRDISPHNVLLSDQGEVKLTDFGIAKALGRRERTRTGVIKGKLDFMSPEQASGAELDPRSDIFATGSVLYLMATGARPFQAASDLEALLKVQRGELEDPRRHAPTLAPSVAAIILRAMRKSPSDRYKSAEEMMIAVEELLRGELGSAGQSELTRWLEELARRDRVPPISRAPGLPMPPQEATGGKTLALRAWKEAPLGFAETQVQLSPTPPPGGQPSPVAAPPGAPAPPFAPTPPPVGTPGPPRPRPPRRRRGIRPALPLGLLLLGGAAFVATSPRKRAQLLESAERTVDRTVDRAVDRARAAIDVPPLSEPERRRPGAAAGRDEPPPAKAERPIAAEPAGGRAREDERRPREEAERREPTFTSVRLESRPTGAVVRLEKRRLGATPTTVRLEAGARRELVFSKPGYADARRSIEIGGRAQKVSVSLSRLRGKRGSRR